MMRTQTRSSASEGASPGRYFDSLENSNAVTVLPGRHYVTDDPSEHLVTVLGSCVAACIRDVATKIGGLNHFLLPGGTGNEDGDGAMRYGDHAMEVLINEILRRGGVRERLEVKIFGGSNLFDGRLSSNVGGRNVEFVEAFLKTEGLTVAARHVGGDRPRRIHYWPSTGKVRMRLLQQNADQELKQQERRYRETLNKQPTAGAIELF